MARALVESMAPQEEEGPGEDRAAGFEFAQVRIPAVFPHGSSVPLPQIHCGSSCTSVPRDGEMGVVIGKAIPGLGRPHGEREGGGTERHTHTHTHTHGERYRDREEAEGVSGYLEDRLQKRFPRLFQLALHLSELVPDWCLQGSGAGDETPTFRARSIVRDGGGGGLGVAEEVEPSPMGVFRLPCGLVPCESPGCWGNDSPHNGAPAAATATAAAAPRWSVPGAAAQACGSEGSGGGSVSSVACTPREAAR